MSTTRILLSVEARLQAELLDRFLSSVANFEMVGEAHSVIEILMLLDLRKPDLWIHSWEQGPALEGVLSHVYSCCPNLAVVRVAPNEMTGFAEVQINSVANLLKFAQATHQLAAQA
jgi:hypothetical protein